MPGHRRFEREIADIVLVDPQRQLCFFRLVVKASRSIERASDQQFRYAMVYDEIEADVLQCVPKFGGDLGQGAWGASTIIAEIDNRNFIRRILANGSERRGIIVHGNLHGYWPSAARIGRAVKRPGQDRLGQTSDISYR